MEAAKIAVSVPMMATASRASGARLKMAIGARHHVDARGHHGRRVDQGRNRRGAFHRVGQPDIQRNLRRLAGRAHQQQQADGGQQPGAGALNRVLADQRPQARRTAACRSA